MAKKPWRTVHVGEDTGRFTRQQIIDAVEAVKAEKEAKSKKVPRSPSKREMNSPKVSKSKDAPEA